MKKCTAVLLALALLGAVAACGKPATAAGWLDLGEKYLFDLDYEQALLAFEQALNIEPKNPVAHAGKVVVYVMDPVWVGPPPVVPEDVPDFPVIPPLPPEGEEPDPVAVLEPIVEWMEKNGWLELLKKLLELFAKRWPDIVWFGEKLALVQGSGMAQAPATDAAPIQTASPEQNFSVGNTVHLGQYDWLVLEVHSGTALLITKNIVLEQQKYHDDFTEVTWETCALRQYLNDTFFNYSFSEAEQARILLTSVRSESNSQSGTDGGKDTKDRIFILSLSEANQYFGSDSDRIAKYSDTGNTRRWRLRTPGIHQKFTVFVQDDGSIDYSGNNVSFAYGVRPAMWIQL